MSIKTKSILPIAAITLLCSCAGNGNGSTQTATTGAASYFNEKEISHKTDSLMKLMTLDEKIGQLVLFAGRGVVTGPGGETNIEEYISSGMCGGVFNIRTAEETRRLQNFP